MLPDRLSFAGPPGSTFSVTVSTAVPVKVMTSPEQGLVSTADTGIFEVVTRSAVAMALQTSATRAEPSRPQRRAERRSTKDPLGVADGPQPSATDRRGSRV